MKVPPKAPDTSSKCGRFTTPEKETDPLTQLLAVPDIASAGSNTIVPLRYSISPPAAALKYPLPVNWCVPPLNTSRDPAGTRTSPACTL